VHAQNGPDRVAVVVDDSGGGRPSNTTFRELNEQVNRLAHGLLAAGVRPGDRFVWCGPNSLEVLTTIHAARKCDLVAVPLSYRFNAEEMQYVIENSEATAVVIDAEFAPVLATVRDQLTGVRAVVVYGGDVPNGCLSFDEVCSGQPATEPDVAATTEAGAQMIYTSGTTGKPKGALRTRTDRTLVFTLLSELNLLHENSVHLTTGPMYHSGPLAFASLAHTLGAPVIVLRKFDPVRWIALVREHRVTNTFSAPTQLKRIVSLPDDELAKADMSSMVTLIANAAPVPYALKQEVISKLGDGFLYEVYGSTELGVDTVLKPADQLRKPGSCGKELPMVEIRLYDDDGNIVTGVGPEATGELYVRSSAVFEDYYKQHDKFEDDRRDGFQTVGDVAYRDEEGYLYICDRKRDMIISGGVNIYPAEVEAALELHPEVYEVAVIGIPSDEWGEAVHAVVVPRPGTALDASHDEGVIVEHARGHLAGFKVPRSVSWMSELPKTGSGKILKRELRAPYWDVGEHIA
jgi:acyl-CoA synthetase (AMP-forming)/AMP-acid ligase II